jgi:hypothetical protein
MTTGPSVSNVAAPDNRVPKHVPVLTQVVGPDLLAQLVPRRPASGSGTAVATTAPPVACPSVSVPSLSSQASAQSSVESPKVVNDGQESEAGLEPDALMAELYVEQLGQVIESMVLAELKRQAPALARDIALTLLPKVVSELGLHPKR